jgi:hypothetical protein
MIYIDEYHLNENSMISYSWVKRGQESFIIEQFRKKSYSIIAAIDDSGLIHISVTKENNNQYTFINFL